MRHMRRPSLIVLVLVAAAGFRLLTIDRPFRYDEEATGSFYGVLARNQLRFPLSETRGIPVETVGQSPDHALRYYPDHPPLVPWLIVPLYMLFGVGAWQTRLPSATATVAAVYVLYRLLLRHGGKRLALLGASLFALMPMTLYFGGMPEVVGMPLVLFTLVAIGAYVALHEQPGLRRLLYLISAFSLAGLSDWPAFLIVPIFVVHWFATPRRREWQWIVGFGAAASVLFLLLDVYIAWATGSPWTWMVPLVAHRSAIGEAASFTAREWLSTAWTYNWRLHTVPVLAASAVWLLTSQWRHTSDDRVRTFARIVMAWGVLHVAVGREGVFTHRWWWWPLTPGLAVTAALAFEQLLVTTRSWRVGHAASPAAALLVAGFGAWTVTTAYRELTPPASTTLTTEDLGLAIQAAAPHSNDVALLVWSGSDPQVWFYGDRPVRANIWSVDDLERRLHGDTVDLVFDDAQPWNAPATGLVFPLVFSDLQQLHAYLMQTYRTVSLPDRLADKFDVFDVRQPIVPTP
jgi:hypothetical protein